MASSKVDGALPAEPAGSGETLTYRIHPGLGIARLGDSEHAYFVGPEAPGWRPPPVGGYKDDLGKVKRQAARFRIFEYGPDGVARREVTGFEASITWMVHLANKKGAWYRFVGRYPWKDPSKRVLRNGSISAAAEQATDPDRRIELIVDPGQRSISGFSQPAAPFDTGSFRGRSVYLGELRTDGHGRLLVFGGRGESDSVDPDNPLTNFSNNDGWCDDTADGPVAATLTLPDGRSFTADPAWVIVAPPKFAPDLDSLVTLDDVVHEVAVAQQWTSESSDVEFYRDVFPLLRRACRYGWVNATSYRAHAAPAAGNFLDPERLEHLRDPSPAAEPARRAVLQRLRPPAGEVDEATAKEHASWNYMPLTAGDGGEPVVGDPTTWFTVLPSQYRKLQRWAAGEFSAGWPAEPVPLDRLPVAARPQALDRSALEPCAGGPFYPGIEMTFISAEPSTWRAPYRIADGTTPGGVTKWMAVPWQADFFECMSHWWPANRPDDVIPEGVYESVAAGIAGDPTDSQLVESAAAYRAPWTRGLPEDSPAGDNSMVRYWSELGFVVPTKAPTGETVFVERQRSPLVGLDPRELFYKLMNVDRFPEVLPKARAYAEQCLAAARRYQLAPDAADIWRSFEFTPDTFQARIMETYRELAVEVASYDPSKDPTYRSAADVRERIRQFSPFNMSDGSWLRNVTRIGPFDEARALLFSVLMDEMGDGEVSHNHSNIYRDLCHSIGFYPPDCTSEQFAFAPEFLDSAFEIPTFELAISQFSDDYYPELLGMTLWLELGIIEAKNTIALIEHYGFDARYWIMHVGIDNPVNGHAARAIRAILLYLDGIRSNAGGEEAVEAQWKRIWDGYVAFGTTGTFGDDFARHLRSRPSLDDQVTAMIRSKAEFGSMNHDEHRLQGTPINEWFLDPEGLKLALIKDGLFVPGDPDGSPFFRLTSFETGRMYRVFTDDELKLWADWCRSKGRPPEAQPEVVPADESYTNMVRLVDWMREGSGRGVLEAGLARVPVPDAEPRLTFERWMSEPARDVLAEIASPALGLIDRDRPRHSSLVTQVLEGASVPGHLRRPLVAEHLGRPAADVVLDWVADGAPVPPAPSGAVRNLWLESTRDEWESHPTRRIVGLGAIH